MAYLLYPVIIILYKYRIKKVTVKMPIIESLRASASSITSANTIKGENKLKTSSASNINLNIESDYIEKASSGSSITIKEWH
jgi:hypothetical protein